MAGKLVRVVQILLIKVLRRNATFLWNWWSYCNSWSKRNRNYSVFRLQEVCWNDTKGKVSRAQKKRILFSMFIPWSITKHRQTQWWKFQRDFICKTVSHDKYPTKKHILVCHEHRGNTENEQLLLEYKNRCIMKQTKLAEFSRDLKLTFHMNQQQPSGYKHLQSNQ